MLSRIVPTTTTAGTYNDTNFRSLNSVSICRYKNNYLWNLNRRRVVGPVMVVKADEQVNSSSVVLKEKKEKSLGDRLRLGSLTEDGLCYKERFVIRCYEVGINKTATVETIANLLQEVGGNHGLCVGYSTDGFATTTTMRKLHLIWVTSRMHIEIHKYPAWSDVVEIETWYQSEGKIGFRRDWIIKDLANGDVIGRATSKWVMMNSDTRRLQKVNDDVRDDYFIFSPKTTRLAFTEENNNSQKKIAKIDDPAEYSTLRLVPRRADLDMNKHVNNVTYIGWVLELSIRSCNPIHSGYISKAKKKPVTEISHDLFQSIPQEVIDTHELQSITLDYRRECQHNDVVDSLTSSKSFISKHEGSNGYAASEKDEQDLTQFLHLLRSASEGLELNRGRTEWRKKADKL